jgi:hypothetical protein
MMRSLRFRTLGGWLALFGLVLQVALSAAHSAQHFDHLTGPLGAEIAALQAAEPARDPASSVPDRPAAPDRDRCAVDLSLAATGHLVLAEPARIPLRPEFEIARLDAAAPSVV